MAASARGHQRTDSTHVLAKVRALNRTECVVETLRHGLNVLAVVAPDWGLRQVQPEWLERYGPRESRVSLSLGDRQTPAVRASGGPGWMGFDFLRSKRIPKVDFLLSIPAIDTDASRVEAKLLASRRRWNLDCRPGSERRQRSCSIPPMTSMRKPPKNGQRIGLDTKCISPQTCDEELPGLITHVATAIGPIPDREALPEIHAALQQQELLASTAPGRCRIR